MWSFFSFQEMPLRNLLRTTFRSWGENSIPWSARKRCCIPMGKGYTLKPSRHYTTRKTMRLSAWLAFPATSSCERKRKRPMPKPSNGRTKPARPKANLWPESAMKYGRPSMPSSAWIMCWNKAVQTLCRRATCARWNFPPRISCPSSMMSWTSQR